MAAFDSSGIEAFVTENNPKYANRIIRQFKTYTKANGFNKNYDLYKAVYGSMPAYISANSEIKQSYINGHFCYVFKFVGIIQHISLYNKDSLASHPAEIIVEKKSTSPNEDKYIHDVELLIPTLKVFLQSIRLLIPKHFLVMQHLTHTSFTVSC